MLNLLLVRDDPAEDGTPGELTGLDFDFPSLEKNWINNEPNLSCVPAGKYKLEWDFSQKFYDIFPDIEPRGMCYHIMEVPNRTGILLHNANRAEQLEGCIALGLNSGVMPDSHGKPVKAVLRSKNAIRAFHKSMHGEPALLEIVWRTFVEKPL